MWGIVGHKLMQVFTKREACYFLYPYHCENIFDMEAIIVQIIAGVVSELVKVLINIIVENKKKDNGGKVK